MFTHYENLSLAIMKKTIHGVQESILLALTRFRMQTMFEVRLHLCAHLVAFIFFMRFYYLLYKDVVF